MSSALDVICRNVTAHGAGNAFMQALLNKIMVDDVMQ
jgi:hypothetical protein